MKKSRIDKAIAKLEADRAVIDLAILTLQEMQRTTKVRRPRVVNKPDAKLA